MSLLRNYPVGNVKTNAKLDLDLDPLFDLGETDHIYRERLEMLIGLLKTGTVTDCEYVKKLIFDLAEVHGKVLPKETIRTMEEAEKSSHEFMVNMMLNKIWHHYGIFLTALEVQKTIERLMYHFEKSGKTWEDFKTTEVFVKGRIKKLFSEIDERVTNFGYEGSELLRTQKEMSDLKDYLSSTVKVF